MILKSITRNHHVLIAKVNYNHFDKLFSLLEKNKIELSPLGRIKNIKRKIEWLTVRSTLIEFFGKPIEIVYDQEHKPHLSDNSTNISISHSHEMIALSLNNDINNGIDIQHLSNKIIRIKEKFLSPQELEKIDPGDVKTLTLYWSIKEALFKVYGKNDIFLKENIEVVTFCKKTMTAVGRIKTDNYFNELRLNLEIIDDYSLAYTVNS